MTRISIVDAEDRGMTDKPATFLGDLVEVMAWVSIGLAVFAFVAIPLGRAFAASPSSHVSLSGPSGLQSTIARGEEK